MPVTTRCHIVGPGAIGGLFAFRLKAAGFDVSLIARSGGTRQQELTLLTEAGEQATVFAVEGPDAKGPIQLLWITTKSYSALEAATQLSHRFTPETVIVTLGNGMGYHERLSTLVLGKLIGGSTTAGCSSPSENTRKLAGEGQTRLGWWDGTETPPAWIAKLREAPWFGNWELNIEKSLLEKLAINSIINPMTALMNITNGELIDAPYKTTLNCAIREVADIFHWSGHSDIADNLHQRVFNVIDDTAFNSSSMRIDRQRHTQTEHEEILGHLLESFGETTTLEKPATPLLSEWLNALRQPYPNQ